MRLVKQGLFVTLTLGFLTAFGPFVTDFYLPAMPSMADDLNTSPQLVSLTITMGMLGLALGQVLVGPLSDKYGRRGPLIASMAVFVLASVACLFAPDIVTLNVLRVFQGLGGAGGIVLSKSVATDMYSGEALAKFMAVLAAINGIAPVSAPVVGGLLMSVTGWRGIFAVLLGVGVVLLVCSCFLAESLPAPKRLGGSLVNVYANLFRVFRNPVFLTAVLLEVGSFLMFFGYLSSSPFILQSEYGMSPLSYSLAFAVNALMIGVGSGLCGLFRRLSQALLCGGLVVVVASAAAAICLVGVLPLGTLLPCYAVALTGFGILQPAATSVALDSERANAGAASAVFGASNFVAGAVASPLVAVGGMRVGTSVVMVVGAALACGFAILLRRYVRALSN